MLDNPEEEPPEDPQTVDSDVPPPTAEHTRSFANSGLVIAGRYTQRERNRSRCIAEFQILKRSANQVEKTRMIHKDQEVQEYLGRTVVRLEALGSKKTGWQISEFLKRLNLAPEPGRNE